MIIVINNDIANDVTSGKAILNEITVLRHAKLQRIATTIIAAAAFVR